MTGRPQHGFGPGEWSDDTSLTIAIAIAALRGTGDGFLERVAEGFVSWGTHCAKGIGSQTKYAIASGQLARGRDIAAAMTAAARDYPGKNGLRAGNGALMRAAVVGCLSDDPIQVARLSADICRLTHFDDDCVASAILWAEAIRSARVTGRAQVADGLSLLEPHMIDRWRGLIDEAENEKTWNQLSRSNRSAVGAFQQAWATAIRLKSTEHAIKTAILAGGDTDTVAAILAPMSAMLHPEARVPGSWIKVIHGWPGMKSHDLGRLGSGVDLMREREQGSSLAS